MITDIQFTKTISIKAPPQRVWQAIVEPDKSAQYYLAPMKKIQPHEGGRIAYGTKEKDLITGTILRFEPAERLDHTFRFCLEEGTADEPETLVSYRLEADGSGTRLTISHSGFPEENQTFANISGGWPYILDGLKKLLE